MKKLLIATIISLFVIGMAVSSYAVDDLLTTGVTVTVGDYCESNLLPASTGASPTDYRSAGAITFETVTGLKASGWYYNTLAGLDGNGDPNDSKSDVGIGIRSNIPFTISIKKNSDALDGKLGYNVDEAFNWTPTGGSVSVPTVSPGTLFAGTAAADKWGELTSTPAPIFADTAGNGYPAFSMGVSFALVPGALAQGTYDSTVITYTITHSL